MEKVWIRALGTAAEQVSRPKPVEFAIRFELELSLVARVCQPPGSIFLRSCSPRRRTVRPAARAGLGSVAICLASCLAFLAMSTAFVRASGFAAILWAK